MISLDLLYYIVGILFLVFGIVGGKIKCNHRKIK